MEHLLADSLLSIGSLGVLGTTIGCTGLASLFSKCARRPRSEALAPRFQAEPQARPMMKIDLLITAHNEEELIERTLGSLAAAATRLRESGDEPVEVRYRVGLDHCTDATETRVRQWAQRRGASLETVSNPLARGKWNMLFHLITQSDADWVALIDVGAIWDPSLLLKASRMFADESVLGIAPSYLPARAGRLEKFHWSCERLLKVLESDAGGPTAVHGATVFYRREPLLRAFTELNRRTWLNDDVSIPLMLRIQSPRRRIVYLFKPGDAAWVRDIGVSRDLDTEYRRRKRMLLGNLQWIDSLYRRAFAADVGVGLIASRRVFRVFWAYWLVFLLGGVALYEPKAVVALLLAGALARLVASNGLRRLGVAFLVGLEAPFQLTARRADVGETWS